MVSKIWLEARIKQFINESPQNTLYEDKYDQAFAEPIIGYSSGDDPVYQFFKQDIGDFYWTPLEIFSKTFPRLNATSTQLTVISWILPQIEANKATNRKQTYHPSERWARARWFGEEVNINLRKHVVATLEDEDIAVVAPLLSPLWSEGQTRRSEMRISERYGFASPWSERHTAYASGLGTFGLCDGLITPKGKAMRCGSVIANINLSPTKRPYTNHHAYCLFYSQGICGRCIQRCPAGAITRMGHNKVKCREHLGMSDRYMASHIFGFDGRFGCGLCQTNVPCESKIPTEDDLE